MEERTFFADRRDAGERLLERLRHETGMPIIVAERPLDCVALGSGKCVEEFEALQQVLVSEPRR